MFFEAGCKRFLFAEEYADLYPALVPPLNATRDAK
jgi:hypothetical protein